MMSMHPMIVEAEHHYRTGQRSRRMMAVGRIPPRTPRPTVECPWCGVILRQGHREGAVSHAVCLPCRREHLTMEADDV